MTKSKEVHVLRLLLYLKSITSLIALKRHCPILFLLFCVACSCPQPLFFSPEEVHLFFICKSFFIYLKTTVFFYTVLIMGERTT